MPSTELRIWVKPNPNPHYRDWLWQVVNAAGTPVEDGYSPTRTLAIDDARFAREKTRCAWEEIGDDDAIH